MTLRVAVRALALALAWAGPGLAQTTADADLLANSANGPSSGTVPGARPAFTLLRYDERYDAFADPALHQEPLDALKHWPLRDASFPWLSLGGEWRERYEWNRNRAMGLGPNAGHDDYLLHRIVLHADLHLSERARLFVQGFNALQTGQRGRAPAVNENPADLQQGFGEAVFGGLGPRDPSLTVRGGRLMMSYGAGRLVAARSPGPNVPFRFDGLQLVLAQERSRLQAFLTRPVTEVRDGLDGENDGQAFWGAYGSRPLGQGSMDLYYLGLRDTQARFFSGTGIALRHTLGLRWSAAQGPWSWDWEPVLQFGRFDRRDGTVQDIRAWTLATETTRRLPTLPWAPKLSLKVDYASGDDGPAGRRLGSFDPLFFKSSYFNDASLLRPTNLFDIHPTLTLQPHPTLSWTLGANALWRARRTDGIYGANGSLQVRPYAGSRRIGTTGEVTAQWQPQRHLTVTLAYVHLFASDALKTAGGRDVDYFGSWINLVW